MLDQRTRLVKRVFSAPDALHRFSSYYPLGLCLPQHYTYVLVGFVVSLLFLRMATVNVEL